MIIPSTPHNGILITILGVAVSTPFFIWAFVLYRRHISSNNDLEIRVTQSQYLGSQKPNPFYSITPGKSLGAHFELVLINHNTEKAKHIESASLSLKRRTILGNKSLFSVPVEYLSHPENRIIQDITLEPQEKLDVAVSVHKDIPIITPFPHKSKLVLVLKMVGSQRNVEYELDEIKHDSKLVPDIPDSESE